MSGPCLKRRQAKILLLSAILSTVALAQSGLASPSLSAPPGGTILLAQSGPGAPNQRDQIEDAPRARRKAESTAQLQVQWQQAPGQQTGPLSARRVHGVRATPAPKLPRVVRQGQQASEAAFTTAGVAPRQESAEPFKLANSQLEPVKWAELEGWAAEDHVAALDAFQVSCQPLRRIKRPSDDRPIYVGLWEICRRAPGVRAESPETARSFFEENFRPVRISRLGEAEGFLTGYYEPVVQGSRFPNPEFNVPVYRRPRDLIAAGYKPGADAFPNKGARIGRLNENNQLVPYYDRAAIEAGALDGQRLEICWVKDPSDVLAMQIEGSARVILEDGTPLRIRYDSHNGYPFSAVGRVLIERNLISREEISMQRIREWMAANPEEAPKLRATNRSYVFFRVTGLTNEGESIGAQGVPLTPGRSIAVDRMHEYGTPFFIEANLPIETAKQISPFRHLMIAQDTGSAIVGPARADLYWGAGDKAALIAGRIRHSGRFVMLLPRELDMMEAGSQVPLPTPKPKIAEVEVHKVDKSKVYGMKSEEGKWPTTRSGRQAAPARWRYQSMY
jgi:membrane-bound lytic murein transglycosylase A